MKADKVKVARLLKTARGQLDGILNMIEEDRYCMDVLNQLLALYVYLLGRARGTAGPHGRVRGRSV